MSKQRDVVLIIDDSEENRYSFGRYLAKSEYEVWTAASGEEGLALARKKPSLIMLDIQLPDTTGYELCRVLKADPITSSIPILHTSATFTETMDRTYGLEGGADAYLTQPIDANELTATVKALLRIREAEKSARALASKWQTTFDSISDGLCLVDPAGNIERFNRSFQRLFFDTRLIQKGIPFRTNLESIVELPERDSSSPDFEKEIQFEGRWYRMTSNAVKDEEDEFVGTAWVFSDINSIKEADLKLKNLNQELEQRVAERTVSLREAVHQMEQFSYTVSHDLRAPLRAMSGYSKALLEDCAGLDSESRDYLQRIANNATRLDKMVVDVLTFTRISRDIPILSDIPLNSFIHDIILQYPALTLPEVKIEVDAPHHVCANESGLTQALSNILGNAVKFVAPGTSPRVKIWSETREKNIRLWIEDNGIGIPKEYQSRLFGMFERVLPSDQYEGTGVGLAITQKVIERMGGTVGVESDRDKGSRFWIELAKGEV